MAELPERVRSSIELRTHDNLNRMERVAMLYTPSRTLRNKHEARREASRQCKACYYLRQGRLAGQGFTGFICKICQQERSHPNTAVPEYCDACCAEHGLCQSCGGRLEP